MALTLWGVVGLLLSPATIRRRLAPTIVTAALVAAFHTLTIVSARFHLPLEPFLAIWGAAGAAHWRTDRLVPHRVADVGKTADTQRPLGIGPAFQARLGHHVKSFGIVDRLAVGRVSVHFRILRGLPAHGS